MSEEITRWRKKPVEVEARQWTGGDADLAAKLHLWMLDNGTESEYHSRLWDGDIIVDPNPYMIIVTREGRMIASPGDWIIKGVKGEFYPCKPDIFEKTYEAVL